MSFRRKKYMEVNGFMNYNSRHFYKKHAKRLTLKTLNYKQN